MATNLKCETREMRRRVTRAGRLMHSPPSLLPGTALAEQVGIDLVRSVDEVKGLRAEVIALREEVAFLDRCLAKARREVEAQTATVARVRRALETQTKSDVAV